MVFGMIYGGIEKYSNSRWLYSKENRKATGASKNELLKNNLNCNVC
jgi:hypothetical protein